MIHAILSNGTATALGVTVRSRTPTLTLCRALVAAGHPDQPLTSYRNGTRCLIIQSIHKAAQVTVLEDCRDGPRFARYKAFSDTDMASPDRG